MKEVKHVKESALIFLENEADTLEIAKHFSEALLAGAVVYLQGNLGAGKTCFSRGVIQGLGFSGRVKSPTFTLVEPYVLDSGSEVFHFDFYRLVDPEEVYYLGVEDYITRAYLCLMEWPDKAQGYIPEADVVVELTYQNESREIKFLARTDLGCEILIALEKKRD